MHKPNILKSQKFISALVLGVLITFYVTTAWATVAFIYSPSSHMINSVTLEQSLQLNFPDNTEKPKAHAPEPTTMALFGGGFLGMIMSFVRRTYWFTKRIFDVVCSILGLIILAPAMLFVALLVKLTSKGPIFYSQIRVGKNGHFFDIYKFRTMKVDAEKATGPVWAAQNDNRLTPIGGVLRKLHLDELPQFINVLRGEMSIIGPRPERPVFVEKFKELIPDYEKRLAIKPGITGLAQVWHRYDETIDDVKKKVKYDLLYARRMCLWADVSIIFRTARVVVTGEGAR